MEGLALAQLYRELIDFKSRKGYKLLLIL